MSLAARRDALSGDAAQSYRRLAGALAPYQRLVVAFSGGADSALLAAAATMEHGPARVLVATAVSPSLDDEDRHETEVLAGEWGLRYRAVRTMELDNPDYQRNGLDRCYYCKAELMSVLAPIAKQDGAAVALGVNLDDLGDHRPGQAAAREGGAVFPLVDAELSKTDVRALSRALGLRTWDKPANACLSSRIPQGTPVTVSLLGQVGRAERALRRLGFHSLRVRHYGDTCRIELDDAELELAVARRRDVAAALHGVGYRYVTLDLDGLRSGNLVQTELARQSGAS